ncbi:hypothetical protein [Chitinophaga skermanii]|nr:hypothetical protein [Chitinophaga skermanii]
MKYLIPILLIFLVACEGVEETGFQTGNDTIPYAAVLKYSDSVFKSHQADTVFLFVNPRMSLLIGHPFEPTEKHSIIVRLINDSTANLLVLHDRSGTWDTLVNERSISVQLRNEELSLDFEDYDGDNMHDLIFTKSKWDQPQGEVADLWLYKHKQLVRIKNFDHIINPVYDEVTHRYYGQEGLGYNSMNVYVSEYKLVNDHVERSIVVRCLLNKAKDSCLVVMNDVPTLTIPVKDAYKYMPAYFQQEVKDNFESEKK